MIGSSPIIRTDSFPYDNSNPALDMTEENYKDYINGIYDDVM